jgi:cellulose synthase/poly-beta-1,6-N-acetylglucosamine synthase-like glycosyltransferase
MFIIEILLLVYFAYSVSYTLAFSVAGNLKSPKVDEGPEDLNRMALLIPAYKEDAVIEAVAKKALEQDYPTSHFDVIVIADSLNEDTLKRLKKLPIILIKVEFEQSTKVKSLNAAMGKIHDDYSIGLILDADNIMQEGFLQKINKAYNAGHKVIQGRRVAKNMNTPFAVLDALSEIINNHIYRKGHYVLGMSSSLIGSGMAFHYPLLKSTLKTMKSIGGFDRELEVKLVGQGHKAIYLEDAIVYDEKVEKPEVFANQRRRWIASQFIYLKKYFGKGIKALYQGDMVYFNSAILRNIHLPRLINLGVLVIITGLSSIFNKYLDVSPAYWWVLLGMYLCSFLIAIPAKFYNAHFLKAIVRLPQAFYLMSLSMLRLKGADKQFIHTPHTRIEVEPGFLKNEIKK